MDFVSNDIQLDLNKILLSQGKGSHPMSVEDKVIISLEIQTLLLKKGKYKELLLLLAFWKLVKYFQVFSNCLKLKMYFRNLLIT